MRSGIYALIGLLLLGVLLIGCSPAGSGTWPDRAAYEKNPLAEEAMADLMLEYVTDMQIRAEESGKPITEPKILRGIDEAFIEARALQDESHDRQDAGKMGSFYGVNDSYAEGEVLLYKNTLYTGFEFEVAVVPQARVYLATAVAPRTSEELFSGATLDLGVLRTPYGAQEYATGELTKEQENAFRTVAIYSKPLDRVIALAQIRKSLLQERKEEGGQ